MTVLYCGRPLLCCFGTHKWVTTKEQRGVVSIARDQFCTRGSCDERRTLLTDLEGKAIGAIARPPRVLEC